LFGDRPHPLVDDDDDDYDDYDWFHIPTSWPNYSYFAFSPAISPPVFPPGEGPESVGQRILSASMPSPVGQPGEPSRKVWGWNI